jgi:mycofactocin system glycosyltransferase
LTPLPRGFGVALDRSLRSDGGGRRLLGGAPLRALLLSEAGAEALAALRAGRAESEPARLLARRLIDAGMAHPRPPQSTAAGEVTVAVPVRDRPAMLDRCLTAIGGDVPVVVVDDGSRDARATAAVCDRHGARLVTLDPGEGPASARNAALAVARTELVAFLDSDCIPPPGWLGQLVGHFADPVVGAVAPRIVPVSPAPAASALASFATARSPLDMGPEEGLVGPRRRVPYVPTAALLVRRRALEPAFDPTLQCGEDVDFVWRLHDAGWRIRYVPHVRVEHEEPPTWRGLLGRRFRYGRSAAPLACRHPGRLAHLVLSPWPAAAAGLALAGRPRAAAAVTAAHALVLSRRLRGVGVAPSRACAYAASAAGGTLVGVGHAATMFAAPALLAAVVPRKTRLAALVLLAAGPLKEWARTPPRLDPVRWTAACIADDVAYGTGVWRGCVAHRTAEPLLPALLHLPTSCRAGECGRSMKNG